MGKRSRNAICGTLSVLALVGGGAAGLAAAIDSSLLGAWTTTASDCARLFERRGGVLAYRRPVDKFAQAAIIGPEQILAPSSVCRILDVGHLKDAIALDVECKDSVSFTSQSVQIKVKSATEIVYSPTGDPALDTTMIKCPL